jgi:glycerophosphoryl diester phosphodiesterase
MLFGLLPALLLLHGPLRPLPTVDGGFAVIAHRIGEHENSLAFIADAVRDRADYVEIDLRTTRDKKVVALGDLTLNRTTTAVGRIEDYDLAELSFFKLREPATESIPELETLLKAARGKVNVLLVVQTADPGAVSNVLRRNRLGNSLVLALRSAAELKVWRSLVPEIPCALLPAEDMPIASILRTWQENPFEALLVDHRALTDQDRTSFKSLGVPIWTTSTASDEVGADLGDLAKVGVSGARTSVPRLLALQRKGKGR